MYYLVLLRPGEPRSSRRLDAQHETFIDGLIRRNEVLLGGNLSPRDGLPAAYLLACRSLERAQDLVRLDPYVEKGVFRPTILEWKLVAINPEAVDASLVLRPKDIGEGSVEPS